MRHVNKINDIVRERSYAEIQLSVRELAQAYDQSSAHISCLLHCMQGKSDGFYAEIAGEYGVDVTFLKKHGGFIRRAFGGALGKTALIHVTEGQQIINLLPRITEQGMGGAYFGNSVNLRGLINESITSEFEPTEKVRSDPTHLIYLIDEDASRDSEKIIEIVDYGNECMQGLVAALHL